jgi:TrmH family RNA methyltransferase
MSRNETVIQSSQNVKVKEWAGLLEKKHRDRSGRFLIEGVHLVQEAIVSRADLEVLAYDLERGMPAELAPLLGSVPECEVFAVSPAVMAKCTGTDSPPPVFGIAAKPFPDTKTLFGEGALVVVLDGLRDPGNVGTLIRSADAVGADAVVLGRGSVDLYNPKTVRSTMGSLFHLPVVEGDLAELLPEAKRNGCRVIGTSLQAAKSCYESDWTGGIWLLLGSESQGLSPESLAEVDEAVLIPMRGKAESLNVAMAGTVLLYEAMRQRHY